MKMRLLLIISMFFAVNVYGQDKDKVFQEFETAQNCEFPGGVNNFRLLVAQNIKYPKEAKRKAIQGISIIQFTVNKKGKMEDFKVLKRLGEGCDEAAMDAMMILNTNYTWKPALNKDGKPVKVRKSIPVNFKLDDPEKPKTNPLESK